MIILKIKQMRTSKKMTINQLSKRSGVSISYISEIERGEKHPTIDILCKLSIAMNCNICDLFSCDESIDKMDY